jgi:SAM-dependent methyltransferase
LAQNPSTQFDSVRERELAYYENLYGTIGVSHFAKPAVVAFRDYLVRRILRTTGANRMSRVLSIGCGIGDLELLLAPYVSDVTGVDLSSVAIVEANRAARARNIRNVRFFEGAWQDAPLEGESFDLVLAIFFLHHLPDEDLAAFPKTLLPFLSGKAVFYALEPSAHRLSGFLGKLFIPGLMKKYQTDDERQLLPRPTALPFQEAGFDVTTHWFDFVSTPLAGLFPSWAIGYGMARILDEGLTGCIGLRALSSNFEVIARNVSEPRP